MLNLTGYQETEVLYTGTRTLVYRAIRQSNQQPVIIKVLRNPHPHFNELVGFRNQYVITQNLDSPFIVKPLALERYANGYALVMPDEGALPLNQYWQTHIGQVDEFLPIAIQLAQALQVLNQEQIIHKDIKPANILIHPDTKQVQLIDFSIASLLPKEQQQLVNPNGLEGTLAYISPEQTGRMNRGIDYRTDFYSLGATFYEMLLGTLPFTSQDPIELVHAHIAQDVQFTDHSPFAVPQVLQTFIMKLMAKNAEDRYQSALGLTYDLERCLRSLQSTGEIAEFALGERDLCDRFTIPEKLYGREIEVQTLLEAFNRVANGNSEMLLVAGFSGIGKTAVVNEVHKPIIEKRGYFIKGKYDQFNRNIPFSAFVQAFRDLMGQLLSESDIELAHWKSNILEALGENGQVLIDVIPELERVIGQQPQAPELSGTAAQNRFNLLFQKFIAVFTTPEHPLVLFLDDLQWADLASLNLMKVLMSESEKGYLLLLGAYRDNEVFPAHPLILTLGELEKERAEISTITLAPLLIAEINRLVAETLNCTSELAHPLTELVYQKTQGNPFFSTQFLKGLYTDKLIVFDADLGYWKCDLVQVTDAALTDDVVEFMASRLQKLPQVAQDMLKLAACIGNQFDLKTLGIVCGDSTKVVAIDLWEALREGLIFPLTEVYIFFQGEMYKEQSLDNYSVSYRFLHDRVQQAAYSLIPEEQKPNIHYCIGQQLLKSLSEEEQKQYIFDIANHLNLGRSLIAEVSEKEKLTRLNLAAGQKALASTAYEAAISYFNIGIEFLGLSAWHDCYDLTFELYSNLCSAQLSNAQYQDLSITIQTAFSQSRSPIDRSKIYFFQVNQFIVEGRYIEGIKSGLMGLKELGIDIDIERDNIAELASQEFDIVDGELAHRSMSSLLELPTKVSADIEAKIKLMTILETPSYIIGNIELYTLISLRAVRLSIQHGNIPESIKPYSNYGILLCILKKRYKRGAELGDFALKLSYKLNSPSQRSKVGLGFATCIHVWSRPIAGAANLNYESFLAGLESGEMLFAGYNLFGNVFNRLFQGENLTEILNDIQKYWLIAKQVKDNLLPVALAASELFIKELSQEQLDRSPESSLLDAENIIKNGEISQSWLSVCIHYILKMHLACVTGHFQEGFDYAKKAEPVLNAVAGFAAFSSYFYYYSLILLNLLVELSPEEQIVAWEQISTSQNKLKDWSQSCPENFLHKYDLIEAEKYRVLDQKVNAMERYDRAIAEAQKNGYIQEEALGNELAAKFYLNWGKERIAAVYMKEAYYCYARWGAKVKTNHLEANYPELLTSIVQKQQIDFNPFDSLSSLTQTLTATFQRSAQSSTNISEALDFAAILQAAQKLSSTIELEQLLGEIVHIILTNAGAKKMVLLAPDGQQWQLKATAELLNEGNAIAQTQTEPLTPTSPVPIRLIQYVKNTKEQVLINQTKTDITGILEGYLLKYKPQSVFCMPLLNQGNLIAIAYLEHPTTKGVFTPKRQNIIEFLCAQAAVALQNAQLYNRAQTVLTDLQQAQIQLVQSEKMSALGNLVAGVAHEINNPVGFLKGNIQPAQEYVQDLLNLIDFLLTKPEDDDQIQARVEAIDLEFLREDLPKLIDSMNVGVDRIREISNSLRTFSRKDQEHKTAFNIHDGIDSTLLILKHRTKANEERPQIQILKNYGELPEVGCFPGQLNQVFMNILANAIDAFDEANRGKTYEEIEANPNRIAIATSMLNEQVQIQIQDNGCGMKPETAERIFEQGFTTKDVGKGTGLGMAIARQIIEEKHNGMITCISEHSKGTKFAIKLPISPA